MTKEEADKQRGWKVVDAANIPLGRLASQIATILTGKLKPTYSPQVDCGDFVVVINAERVALSGNKLKDKKYYHHTGYIGGIKEISAGDLLEKHPDRVITKAVKNMVPKTKLGNKQMKKLKVYAGNEHPHIAQNPEAFKISI